MLFCLNCGQELTDNVKYCPICGTFVKKKEEENKYNLEDVELKKLDTIALVNSVDPYIDITPYILGFSFPTVNYEGVFVQPDEVIIFAAPASTYKDKDRIVGYTGKSSGVNVRIAKGISYRTGGSRGKPIHGKHRDFNMGDIVITNKRVIFIGEESSFEFATGKISAYKILSSNSFSIQSGKSSRNIMVNDRLLEYVVGFIKYVVESYTEGISLQLSIKKQTSEMTENQKNLCYNVRQKTLTRGISKGIVKNHKKRNGYKSASIVLIVLAFIYGLMGFVMYEYREMLAMMVLLLILGILFMFLAKFPKEDKYIKIKGKRIKKSIIITIAFFMGFMLFGFISLYIQNNKSNVVLDKKEIEEIKEYKYSIKELLALPSHPLVFNDFNNAKQFYKTIDDDRIAVVGIQKQYQMERDVKKIGEDPIIMYITQHSTNPDFIGTIKINLFDQRICDEMNLDKAIQIITSYLPINFLELYKKDWSYIYKDNQSTVYTYAGRLNESGLSFSNNGHSQYSYYYGFSIFHYEDSNYWILETEYASHANKTKGWFENYAEEWNIDLENY